MFYHLIVQFLFSFSKIYQKLVSSYVPVSNCKKQFPFEISIVYYINPIPIKLVLELQSWSYGTSCWGWSFERLLEKKTPTSGCFALRNI